MELQDFAPQQIYSQLEFSPAASIVDRRGETAESMLDFLKLSNLSLHPTAVELTSEDGREQYRIGLIQIYGLISGFVDFEEASEKVGDFLRMAVDHLGPPTVEAINLRTCDIAPVESFENLRDRLNETLVAGIGGVKSAIGVPLSDSGWVFEFEDAKVSGRIQFGPMKSDQLKEILKVEGDIEVPPNMLFLLVESKFQGNDHEDPIKRWQAAVAKQRGMADRIGAWLAEMIS